MIIPSRNQPPRNPSLCRRRITVERLETRCLLSADGFFSIDQLTDRYDSHDEGGRSRDQGSDYDSRNHRSRSQSDRDHRDDHDEGRRHDDDRDRSHHDEDLSGNSNFFQLESSVLLVMATPTIVRPMVIFFISSEPTIPSFSDESRSTIDSTTSVTTLTSSRSPEGEFVANSPLPTPSSGTNSSPPSPAASERPVSDLSSQTTTERVGTNDSTPTDTSTPIESSANSPGIVVEASTSEQTIAPTGSAEFNANTEVTVAVSQEDASLLTEESTSQSRISNRFEFRQVALGIATSEALGIDESSLSLWLQRASAQKDGLSELEDLLEAIALERARVPFNPDTFHRSLPARESGFAPAQEHAAVQDPVDDMILLAPGTDDSSRSTDGRQQPLAIGDDTAAWNSGIGLFQAFEGVGVEVPGGTPLTLATPTVIHSAGSFSSDHSDGETSEIVLPVSATHAARGAMGLLICYWGVQYVRRRRAQTELAWHQR